MSDEELVVETPVEETPEVEVEPTEEELKKVVEEPVVVEGEPEPVPEPEVQPEEEEVI